MMPKDIRLIRRGKHVFYEEISGTRNVIQLYTGPKKVNEAECPDSEFPAFKGVPMRHHSEVYLKTGRVPDEGCKTDV